MWSNQLNWVWAVHIRIATITMTFNFQDYIGLKFSEMASGTTEPHPHTVFARSDAALE